jgi:hypothetical protein
LAQTLEALSQCIGIERYQVTVFCDPFRRRARRKKYRSEVADSLRCVDIARRSGAAVVVNEACLGADANTGRAIGSAFAAGASYHVHLEEDTVPMRGALLWFEWAERLGSDSSFFSVTGYNREPTGQREQWDRRRWFHPWGFSTWVDRWQEVAWQGGTGAWDERLNGLRGDRYEAFPCVSRIQNIGALCGVHVPSAAWHADNHAAREVTNVLTRDFERMGDRLLEYRKALALLLFEREAAGGELSQDEEARHVEQLDEIWSRLTPDEQATMDAELANGPSQAVREEPRLVDRVVTKDSTNDPR